MQTFLVIIACLSIVAAYVTWCLRRDRRVDREHQVIVTALSPGPRIRALTVSGMVRQNPLRARNLAGGSQPVFPSVSADDFGHVPTAQGDAETLHHATTCAELPAPDVGHHASHLDACSSYGGFDGGGHPGH
jgi:hypothetical protein